MPDGTREQAPYEHLPKAEFNSFEGSRGTGACPMR